MQRNTGYFPTESLEPSGNRLFSRSALNEGDLFRGSLVEQNKEQLPFRSLLARMNGKAPADYYTEVLVPREETLEDFIKIK